MQTKDLRFRHGKENAYIEKYGKPANNRYAFCPDKILTWEHLSCECKGTEKIRNWTSNEIEKLTLLLKQKVATSKMKQEMQNILTQQWDSIIIKVIGINQDPKINLKEKMD